MRVEGYSYGEIAKEVNIAESSARVIDFRTKKYIKSNLEKEGLC
jgi:DNA-directed RNA polymerase specialized sigma24 family protein